MFSGENMQMPAYHVPYCGAAHCGAAHYCAQVTELETKIARHALACAEIGHATNQAAP